MHSARVEGRRIVLPTGTTIGIMDAIGLELPMLSIGDDNLAVVFQKDDTDFKILMDNTNSDRGITFKITINNESYWYSIDPGVKGEPMEALQINGRKLHFLSQGVMEGKQVVGETAVKYGIDYGVASEMCCKIKFEVKVEKSAEKEVRATSMRNFRVHHETTFTACAVPTHSLDFLDSASKGKGRTAIDHRDIGDRGVIAFGDKSNQRFGQSKPAQIDESFIITPFVVNLMMKSKYAAV